jgi:ribonuclease HI
MAEAIEYVELEDALEVVEYKLYFDSATNKKKNGVGVVLETPQKRVMPASCWLVFKCSNNMAEYEACILGLKLSLDCEVKRLHVYGDALLIISQINRNWKTRDLKLLPYQQQLLSLATKFESIKFNSISRSKNAYADALATLASWMMIPVDTTVDISVTRQEKLAHCLTLEEATIPSKAEEPWYTDIQQYLKTGQFPIEASAIDRKTIIRLATRYVIGGDNLYRRSHNQVLL